MKGEFGAASFNFTSEEDWSEKGNAVICCSVDDDTNYTNSADKKSEGTLPLKVIPEVATQPKTIHFPAAIARGVCGCNYLRHWVYRCAAFCKCHVG